MSPTFPLLMTPYLSFSSFFLITPFSLVMPSTHLCVRVFVLTCRIMSMLMLILFILSTPDCHLTTAPVFPPFVLHHHSLPRALPTLPAVCCYLNTHSLTHTPSCVHQYVFRVTYGCVLVFFAESLLFFCVF